MCGIVGVIYRDPSRAVAERRLIDARDTLTHRGPDEAGLWIRPGVGLGHRRLKVIDLIGGQQPHISDDGQRALIYNGELYNFRDLRRELESDDVRFRSSSDTEVLFHLLERDRAGAVERASGMFAFGHWDETSRTLTLARDRLGKKPLYYFADDERIVFASELKAILTYLDRAFDIDPVAFDQFLAHGRIASPRTIYAGIRLLEPATVLTLSARDGAWSLTTRRYWEPTPVETPDDDDDAVDALEALLFDAVKRRLVSDVPIGCLLSGGIDSSLITALATKANGGPVKAFSIGFDESEQLNELPFAEMVAGALGCDWHHRLVRGTDFLESLDETVSSFDQPFANFAMFPTRLLARMAREELTVVLSGQGGDELAAGYPGRYGWVMETAGAAAQKSKRTEFAPAVDDLLQHLQHTSFLPWSNAREAMLADGVRESILAHATPFDDLRASWNRTDLHGHDRLRRVLLADCATNLPDYLVTIEERMTMAASLEARNPFLDERVATYLLSLPAEKKFRQTMHGVEAKWIVRELARRHVPRAAIDRPKRGFTPPLDLWITQHESAVRAQILDAEPVIGHLFSSAWKRALREQSFSTLPLMAVFYTLITAVWGRQHASHLTGDVAAAPPIPTKSASPWQAVLRAQSREAVTEARWIAQALGNIPDGARVRLAGDVDGYVETIARGSGLEPVDDAEAVEALVITGCAARQLAGIDAEPTNNLASPDDVPTVLVLVSCSMQEANDLPAALERIGAQITVRGRQAVQTGADRALLVVRGEGRAAAALAGR